MNLQKTICGVFVLTTLINSVISAPSVAQENEEDTNIYLDKISCRELLKMPGEDKKLTLIFFHGLMSAEKTPMVVDRIALREATDQIVDECINNPEATLITVFEKYR